YKVAALLGSQKEQGKILPMVSSFEGVGAFVTTLSCTFIFSLIGAESNPNALRVVWFVYAAWGILLAVCTYLFVPSKTLYEDPATRDMPKEMLTAEEKASKKKENKSVLVAVLTNKMTYIAAFVVLGSYITYSCLTYTQSWLCDIYGMDATTASYFSIIRNQVMKIVAGPLSVVLMSTAVLKSSPTRLCTVTGVLSAIGIGATIMMPTGNAYLPVLMGISIILSLFALLGKAQNFACTGETGVDPKIFGTMTGVVSLIGYSSDTWMYTVIGRGQETLEPAVAYNRVFILAIVGCVMMVAAGAALLISIRKGHKVEA
ncbi:MAG: MFS transporter, partial [Lachnospiraceae bacterium]|nr:MFS transporter [Lachnospiraceae bacterium]